MSPELLRVFKRSSRGGASAATAIGTVGGGAGAGAVSLAIDFDTRPSDMWYDFEIGAC